MGDDMVEDLAVGEYRIDRNDERLIGPHGPVKLGNKAFQVLIALVEREGRLLTKDALFESVWDGMAVSESALTTTVRELRRALGDDPRHPRYIESVYGRGYRLVAEVAPYRDDAAPAPEAMPAETPAAGQPPRIAVGDFRDSATAQNAPHLAPTMREEVLSGLSRFREMQVIDGADALVGHHARDYLLDATFLPDGDGVKMSTRIKRLGDGAIVWAETLPLGDTGIGGGIETIVRQIVGAALPALDQDISIGIDAAGGTLFDRYLVAKRLSFYPNDRADAEQAARELEAIIEARPDFALAYPPLVRLYNTDYGFRALGATGPVERSRALVLAKAGVNADPGHVHAYTVLGFCHLYHGEHDQAQSCFDHALKANPFNPTRLNEVATGMTYLGDFEGARALFEKSDGIQPFADDASQEDLGRLCLYEGRYDDAAAHFSRVTLITLWAGLCVAVTRHARGEDDAAKAVAAWKERVIDGWHRPIPPSDEELVAWIDFHHPFRGNAGKPFLDLVRDALEGSPDAG